MRLIGVLLVVVGCHVDTLVVPDAPTEPDGPPRLQGMFVTWNARPALPGPITDKITITDATFQLEHLQLVSDAGADNRTTRTRYQIAWSAGGAPAQEAFPNAPAAVYQRILLDMRANGLPPYAYDIRGTVRDGDGVRSFRITDKMMLEIPIDCSVALAAGGSVSLGIRVDLKDALDGINWKDAQNQDGMLMLTPAQLLGVHTQLEHAFELDD
jgi:hypothetical protein